MTDSLEPKDTSTCGDVHRHVKDTFDSLIRILEKPTVPDMKKKKTTRLLYKGRCPRKRSKTSKSN